MWEQERDRGSREHGQPVRRFSAPTAEQLADIPWDDLAEDLLSGG